MHADLLNNSLFLRHYNRWLSNPDSIAFIPVAEYFLAYGMTDDAVKVLGEGLKHMPDSIAGRITLAKAYIRKGLLKEADDQLARVIELVPTHTKALDLRLDIEMALRGEYVPPPDDAAAEDAMPDAAVEVDAPVAGEPVFGDETDDAAFADMAGDSSIAVHGHGIGSIAMPAWQTVTMARIYSAQGHRQAAREIYQAILARDPANEAARVGLDSLNGGD